MIVLLFIFLLISMPTFANVTATITNPNVTEGQIVELRLSSDTQQKNRPVLTDLEKDFYIMAQASSASYQNINGKATTSYDFTLNLLPKKTGLITIPAIAWDNQKTKPLQISVKPASDATQTSEHSITITGNIIEESVYENAALTYQAQVISDIDLIETHFIAPQMADAEIIAVGDIQFGQLLKDGIVYRTLTQKYAVFPKNAGDHQIIQGAVFQGVFVKQKHRQRPTLEPFIYGPFGTSTQDIILRAQDVKVNVLPRPQEMQNQWWLPTKSLTMEQTFTPSLENLKVGDSITRTVEITAQDVMGVQLPDLDFQSNADFKIYTDTPKKDTFYSPAKGIVGQLTQSFVFVPLHEGLLTLPEIHISWFNTVTQKEETTVLPEKTINVLPNTTIAQKPNTSKPSQQQTQNKQQPAPAPTVQQNRYVKENNFLYFVAGLFSSLIVFALIVLIFWLRPKKAKLPDLYPKK